MKPPEKTQLGKRFTGMRHLPDVKSSPPIWLWLLLRLLSFPIVWLAFYYDDKGRNTTTLRSFLLTPWYGYDAYHYVKIVTEGYQPGDVTSNFHPLYPWISMLLAFIVRDPLISLLLVASLAGLIFTIAFYRLANLDYHREQAWTATTLMLCWPASVAIFLPYTEAVFLLLAVCCFLAAREGHFWCAGIAAGLATLTRQQGLFLALPLAWELWEASDRDWRKAASQWRSWVATGLVPAAYVSWILYRVIAINDVKPDFSSAHGFIYSVMISPVTFSILDQQQFLLPWTAAWKALVILWRGEVYWAAYGDVMIGALFIGLFIYSWRYLRTSYRIYSLAIILVALSFHTGSIDPYISLPRHMLLAFPVFMGVAGGYRFHRLPFLLTVLTLCQLALLSGFAWQNWIP